MTKLAGLADDDCHILFVSSQTLYLLANYAVNEVNYLARYAKSFEDGGLYEPVREGDAEEIDVLKIANQFSLEVIPMCQELLLEIADITGELNGIKTEIGSLSFNLQFIRQSIDNSSQIAGCCDPTGTVMPPTAPDMEDPITGDPPEDWGTWGEYYTYKCKAANRIADDWIATMSGMATLSGAAGAIGAIALGLFLNTSLMGGLLVGLMFIGFSAAAAATIVIMALIAIIGGGVGLLAYFASIATEMDTNKQTLVCLLFQSISPENAGQIVVDFTTDIAADLTYDPGDDDALFQAQVGIIVEAIFNPALTNLLFELDEETDDYSGTVDCSECYLSMLIHASGALDVGDAIYDQVMHPDMVDHTTYWSNDGPNTWRGLQTPMTHPEDPFPEADPYTLWLRVQYDYKQPAGRAGWGGIDVVQTSVTKYQNRWVHPGDGVWVPVDDTFSVSVDTNPAHDPIYVYIQNEKNYWQVRNITVTWVEAPP